MKINFSDNNLTAGRDNKINFYENSSSEPKKEDITQILEKLLDLCEQNQNLSEDEKKQKIEEIKENNADIREMNAEIVKDTIKSNDSLKQRLKSAGTVAYLETIKTLLPPVGIVIEAIKAWNQPE